MRIGIVEMEWEVYAIMSPQKAQKRNTGGETEGEKRY